MDEREDNDRIEQNDDDREFLVAPEDEVPFHVPRD